MTNNNNNNNNTPKGEESLTMSSSIKHILTKVSEILVPLSEQEKEYRKHKKKRPNGLNLRSYMG
jgi:hypothetical protein